MLHKHQRALHKYSLMKRQLTSAAVQNREPESVEQLESRIVEVGRRPGPACEAVGGPEGTFPHLPPGPGPSPPPPPAS